MRVGYIAHLQDQGCFLDFFESRAERREQTLWKIAYESHGVRHEDAAVRWQANRPDGGVQRGEHPRRNEHFGAAQGIKQSGLARVGVPHKRNRAKRDSVASFPPQSALLADVFDAILNFADAVANASPVRFQLLFSGPAYADAPRSATCPA